MYSNKKMAVNEPVVKYNKAQGSLMTKALMITGLGFAAICGVGYGVGAIYDSAMAGSSSAGMSSQTLGIIGGICLIASMFMAIFWMMKFESAGWGLIGTTFLVYILGQGIGFGSLFLIFDGTELLWIFGLAGGIFLIMGVIGISLSSRAAMSLMKMLMIGTMVYLGLSLMMMLFSMFGVWNVFTTGGNMDWMYWGITVFSGLLALGYIAFDMHMLSKYNEFHNLEGANNVNKIAAFFGFKLLMDLIYLIWIIARIFLMSER